MKNHITKVYEKVPLVSICCLVYNHENYISKALDSFLMQKTNFLFEVVIHDDASTDSSAEIIKEYTSKHPDVLKPMYQIKNQKVIYKSGMNPRFNFPRAKGKYIAICDGDDYWTDPLKLQKQVDFLEENEDYNICFHPVKIFNEENKKFFDDNLTREVGETTDILDLSESNYMHTPSVVLRNNFKIPNWFYKVTLGDWSIYMLVIKDKKIMKMKDVMAVYRVNGGGFWSGQSQKLREKKTYQTIQIIKKNLKGLPKDAQKKIDERIFNYRLKYNFICRIWFKKILPKLSFK